MAKNEVNIHIKTPGAKEADNQVDKTAGKVKKLGDSTNKAGKKGGEGMDQTNQSLGKTGGILNNLAGQVKTFVGAWLGLEGVQQLITWLIEKLERILRFQKEIYQESLKLAEIGQSLEYQTGTVGQQQQWSQKAAQLWEAGGLKGPQVAEQMMVSADIAFEKSGGIKNPQVMAMLKQIAPFIGSAQFGSAEIAQAFDLAGTAGIAPTPEAYQQYFAQLHAGYTSSKATDPGAFITGLQKGVTPYMAGGGSFVEGVGLFSGARAVIGSEALAGTAVEQVSRLSGGAYEKPRLAMEKQMGVKWSDLSMDQRTSTLMQYALGIPESERMQVMAEQGFPAELVSVINKMVSTEAQTKMATTRQAVSSASAAQEAVQAQAYMDSILGQSRQSEARIAGKNIAAGPGYARWQQRLVEAEAEHKILVAQGKDSKMRDKVEPSFMALQGLLEDVENLPVTDDEALNAERTWLIEYLQGRIDYISGTFSTFDKTVANRVGLRSAERYESLKGATVNVTNIQNQTNNYPRQGDESPRTDPNGGPRVP